MNYLLIANILSFISACFTIASSWTKSPSRTYWYQVGQCLVYAGASYFFGVYASIVLMVINAFRNGLVAAGRYNKYWMLGMSLLSLVLGLWVNGGSLAGYLSLFATIYYTIASHLLKSPIAVKINVAIDLALWFVYDFLVIDISNGIVDLVSVILALVTIVRILKESPKVSDKY